MRKNAFLALEDGSLFYGRSSAQISTACAEIVFNTAMSGYQEVCTDPSYANQIIIFTTSHVGNVGVNLQDYESNQVWAKGIIVREMSTCTSNWRAEKSFINFLSENNVPWIEGIDTRKLVRHLRETGCQNGCLVIGNESPSHAIQLARNHCKAEGLDLSKVAIQEHIFEWQPSESNLSEEEPLICVYDFGVKLTILRKLKERGCRVKVVPGDYSAEDILALQPNGIVLSNGPGDPSLNNELIANVKKMIYSQIPILGICFGCQLIGIAAGGKAVKMKFGHHGINHPIYDLIKKKVHITSQNHNFMIEKNEIPDVLELTHLSLFDGSIQGFRLKGYPVFGFQGHPEGSPGPQDVAYFFDEFIDQIHLKANSQSISCL